MNRSISIPGVGRVGLYHEQAGEGSGLIGRSQFETSLAFQVRNADGRVKKAHEVMAFWDRWWGNIRGDADEIKLGTGLTTNVGVNLLAWNDEASVLGATMSLMKYQAIGTGVTAAAASDFFLQTAQGATNLSGTTNGYMTATQTVLAPNTIQSVATFTATGSIAVTEWALTMSNAANFSRTETGTPTATTFPDSGAAFTTAGTGLEGWTIEIASSAINTPTSTVMGLVTSNTATQLNIAEGWFTLADAGASTPSASSAYVVYPTAWDHKVFAAVNLASGDSLQTTYKSSVTSGT